MGLGIVAGDSGPLLPSLRMDAYLNSICRVLERPSASRFPDAFERGWMIPSGTGFLIHPRVVMTASHVIDESGVVRLAPRNPGVFGCLFGVGATMDRTLYGDTVHVSAFERLAPPITGFSLDEGLQDIALLLLDSPVLGTPFGIGSGPSVGDTVQAVGFGMPTDWRPSGGIEWPAAGWLTPYVTHVPSNGTSFVTRWPGEIYEAGQTRGDSGGPAIVSGSSGVPAVVGCITKVGKRIGYPQVWALYTRLDANLSWIDSVMSGWGLTSGTVSADGEGTDGAPSGTSVLPWLLGGAAVLGIAALLAFGGRK